MQFLRLDLRTIAVMELPTIRHVPPANRWRNNSSICDPISYTHRDLLPRREMETRDILAEKIAVVGYDRMSSPYVNSCSGE